MLAGSFRIATGYVEVTTKLDREALKAAAREAGTTIDTEMGNAGKKSGDAAGGKFASEFRSKIDSALRNMPNIKVGADTTDAGIRVARLKAELEALRDEKVGVTIDENDATAKIARIKAELEALGKSAGSSRIRVDTTAAAKDLTSFTSMVKSAERTAENSASGLFSAIGAKVTSALASSGEKIDLFMSQLPSKLLSPITSLFSKLGGILGSALGFLVKWGSIVGNSLQVVPPVIYAIAAGLASIPALAVGAAGAIATLGLGFHGIGAAISEVFNPPAGGGAGSQMDQVASAERRLAGAQRQAADAQTNLNKARAEAVNDLIDLNLQLAGAHLDEQAAILQVKQAQIDLANARNTAQDPLAQERAKLALLQANQGLKEAKQHTIELQQQTDQANAAGVEGSDKVKAALEQQQNAADGLLDAQDALKQAYRSAGAAGQTAYSKLSTNAKAFVDEIRKLKPQLDDLQHYVQDRLFAGLGAKLDVWAHEWLPQLRRDMGDLAGSANIFVKRLGDDLSKPEVRSAVHGVFDSMERVLDRFTNGGALDKLVKGFSDLVRQATPFVEKIATGIVDELGRLGDWLSGKAKSGAMSKFFSDAAHDAEHLWNITKDVFTIIADIIDIAFKKEQQGANGNPLDQIKDTLDKVKSWVESDKGKKTISDIIQGFHDVAAAAVIVIKFVAEIITKVMALQREVHNWWKGTSDAFTDIKDTGKRAFLEFEGAVVGVFRNLLTAADTAFGWMPGIGGKLNAAKSQFDSFARGITDDLNSIPDQKDITVTLKAITDIGSIIGSFVSSDHRYGGIDYAGVQSFASGGLLPGVYKATNKAIVRFAEPETGAELYMPQNSSDSGRQQALASTAASWAGGRFVPNEGGQAMAPQVIHVHNYLDGKEIGQGLVLDSRAISAAAQKGNRQRRFTDPRVK